MEAEALYRIEMRGRLSERWAERMGDVRMNVTVDPQGKCTTRLTGRLDTAALHGILATLRDLNVVLLSVIRLEAEPGADGESEDQPDFDDGGIQ